MAPADPGPELPRVDLPRSEPVPGAAPSSWKRTLKRKKKKVKQQTGFCKPGFLHMVILRKRKCQQRLQLSWGFLGVSNPPSRPHSDTLLGGAQTAQPQKGPEWYIPAALRQETQRGRPCGRWGATGAKPRPSPSLSRAGCPQGPQLSSEPPELWSQACVLALHCPLVADNYKNVAKQVLAFTRLTVCRGQGDACTPALPAWASQGGAEVGGSIQDPDCVAAPSPAPAPTPSLWSACHSLAVALLMKGSPEGPAPALGVKGAGEGGCVLPGPEERSGQDGVLMPVGRPWGAIQGDPSSRRFGRPCVAGGRGMNPRS